jgi:hypothetical protein
MKTEEDKAELLRQQVAAKVRWGARDRDAELVSESQGFQMRDGHASQDHGSISRATGFTDRPRDCSYLDLVRACERIHSPGESVRFQGLICNDSCGLLALGNPISTDPAHSYNADF